MIAKKGANKPSAGKLATYLERTDKNEKVIFHGAKGTVSKDIRNALLEMEAMREGTRCKDNLYHVSLRLREGEHLTPEQWERAQEILAEEIGFIGHQSLAVEHQNGESSHYHLVFNRINPETLKAQSISWNYAKHERAERRMEKEFGLEPVQGRFVSADGQSRADHGPTQGEVRKAKAEGGNVYEWRAEVKAIAASLEAGADLRAALEDRGFLLCRGNKVAFLILDEVGKEHRLAQTLGVAVKDLPAMLGGLDPASLPTVGQAKEQQQERKAEQEQEKAPEGGATYHAPSYDRAGLAAQQKAAQRDFVQRSKTLTDRRDEKAEQERKAKAEGAEAKQKADRQRDEQRKAQDAQPQKQPAREMTEAQVRQQQKQAAQEVFEMRFGRGHNDRDFNTWEQGRDRER